jgi:16S rRNA (cytidine1402-2'-O)-methyltransferase
MLYLISTPIGNLQDISLRALTTLKNCDYILCEDTRHSQILFRAHAIQVPLKSFHQFNEKKSEDVIVQDLKNGKSIGLISDAGTPGICDPGESLIKRCYAEKLPLTAIPGACAWAMALSLSPFPKDAVQFLGFLPKKTEERKKILASSLLYRGTTIFYESPNRVVATLQELPPNRHVCVMRELTKLHEELHLGTAQELTLFYTKTPPRGECVLVIEPPKISYSDLSLEDHVQYIVKTFHLSVQDAIKAVADIRDIPKREVYKSIHS